MRQRCKFPSSCWLDFWEISLRLGHEKTLLGVNMYISFRIWGMIWNNYCISQIKFLTFGGSSVHQEGKVLRERSLASSFIKTYLRIPSHLLCSICCFRNDKTAPCEQAGLIQRLDSSRACVVHDPPENRKQAGTWKTRPRSCSTLGNAIGGCYVSH